jgi:hypothetical protein
VIDQAHQGGDRGEPPPIFLSHSSKDLQQAREIRALLERHGYSVWMAPDSIRSTGTWVDEIVSAVQTCPVMVVVISENSMSSQHVAREVSMALDEDKNIIPLRVTPAELSGALNYLLHLSQWVIAYPGPLEGYAQDLVRRLDEMLGPDHSVDDGSRTVGQPARTNSSTTAQKKPRRGLRNKRVALPSACAIVVLIAVIGVAVSRHTTKPTANGAQDTDGPTGSSSTSPSAGTETSTAQTETADAALSAIPGRLRGPGELGGYLPAIARAAGLPRGDSVQLLTREDSTGSISVITPSTWNDVDGANPLIAENGGKPLGDILVDSIDESRLYKNLGSGLTVSVAVPRRKDETSLATAFPDGLYLSLGCIDSKLITVTKPYPGQVRVWSSCNRPMIFVIGYFGARMANADLFCILSTEHEADVAGAMFASISLRLRRVRTYPRGGGDKILP